MNTLARGWVGKARFAGTINGLALIFLASLACAATTGIEQLANYKGKNREQVLIDGARKEGLLYVYTSMNAKDSQPVVDGFQKKYPFIKVDLFPGRNEDVASRLIAEQKGGRFSVDTFNANTISIEQLRREGLLTTYYTPAQDIYNKKYIDPNKYWVSTYFNILTFVYNTNEIKEPPKNWQDLLDPRWKGKLALEDADEIWIMNFWKLWGEAKAKDYFTRLGKQDLKIVHGHSVLMQMLISGDSVCSPTQYVHQAIADKKSGAPINLVIMDPMVVGPSGQVLLKNAPHPHAALLFIDYVTSKEEQVRSYNKGRNVPYPGVDPLLKDANLLINDPSLSLDNFDYWQKLYKDLLINPNKRR